MIMNQAGMNVVLTATKVTRELAKGAFQVPEGYKLVTSEELEKELGGLGGNMGF